MLTLPGNIMYDKAEVEDIVIGGDLWFGNVVTVYD